MTNKMRNRNGLTYPRLIALGVFTELLLLAVQYIYINISASEAGTGARFTSEYMRNSGFYIFQVAGFFLYTVVVYLLNKSIRGNLMYKLLAFLVGGALVEMSFYLTIQASYQGVFVYSLLDKAMAAVFASIVFYYSTDKVRHV